MQKKRLLVVGGSLAAAVVVALLVVPSFIDWSKYQSIAQAKIKEAAGYDLAINGAFRIALLPSPHAVIEDVVVKKPVQGREDAFLTLEKADVRLALLPLLTGKIEIASVTLQKPIVTLVTYKNGADNYMPVKQQSAATPAQADAGGEGGSGQAVTVNGFRIEDGKLTMRDEATGKAQVVDINELRVKADTLSGPFEGDGKIGYGQAVFNVSVSTGGYKPGESMPVQFNASDDENRAELRWSGVVVTSGPAKEAQGEMALNFGDLNSLLNDIGMPMAVPSLGERTKISGMLTASDNHVGLTNGDVELAGTRFKTKVDVNGLKSDAMTVSAVVETSDVLDVGAFMDVADKVAKDQKKAEEGKKDAAPARAAPAAANAPLLAPDFALPETLKGDVKLAARGLKYKGKNTGAFEARLTAAGGKGDVRVTLADIPGGGNIALTAATTQKGVVEGTVIGAVDSLRATLGEWLQVVDPQTLDQPGLPRRVDMDADLRVQGNTAAVTFNTLSLGEPKITGTVSYIKAARPVVDAKLNANVWTLPAPAAAKATQGEGGKTETAAASPEIKVDFDPPQLPFDLKFDVALGRLVRGDLSVTDVRVAGAYDGRGVKLTTAQGNVNGGTVSATGTIADLKAMSGVDMQAGLRTSDIETFAQAMTGKPLPIKQKIGGFNGALKAKGDRKAMQVAATAEALGYTLTASGTLDDPFSPELPGTLAVRVRHPDMVQAIRAFSPGFGNASGGAARPIDIAGNVKIAGQTYALENMKAVLGSSDIAGAFKADLSGSVPAITADLTSKTLDVGALVGVNGKAAARNAAASGTGSATTTAANTKAGQWSPEPLDTGFMKSVNADVKLAAGTFIYGTWTLTDAKAALSLKDGVLTAPVKGNMFGGAIDANLNASSGGTGQPLALAFKADVKDVGVGPFLQALTSSTAKRADGKGSVSLDIKGAGTSAQALVGSLNGAIKTQTSSLVIYGMDIDKLAANIVEAFDGGWKGVLANFGLQGFSGGQTQFKDLDQAFTIANGDMPINNFRMETTKGNATLITNGTVSFARWTMDVQSNVQVTQPKDVPVVSVRLAGPLDAPAKTVSSQALDNLVRAKLGNKVQDLLGDKLKDSPAAGIINQFLGGGAQQQPAPMPTPEATPAPITAPDVGDETPAAAPAQQQQQKTPQQQLLEGVLNGLSR